MTKTKKILLQDFWCANMEIFLLYNKPIFSSFFREIEVIINLGAFLLAALPSLREVRCHFEATDQKIRKSPIFLLQHGRRTLGMEKKVIFFLTSVFCSNKVSIKLIFEAQKRLNRLCRVCWILMIVLWEWQMTIGVGDTDLHHIGLKG